MKLNRLKKYLMVLGFWIACIQFSTDLMAQRNVHTYIPSDYLQMTNTNSPYSYPSGFDSDVPVLNNTSELPDSMYAYDKMATKQEHSTWHYFYKPSGHLDSSHMNRTVYEIIKIELLEKRIYNHHGNIKTYIKMGPNYNSFHPSWNITNAILLEKETYTYENNLLSNKHRYFKESCYSNEEEITYSYDQHSRIKELNYYTTDYTSTSCSYDSLVTFESEDAHSKTYFIYPQDQSLKYRISVGYRRNYYNVIKYQTEVTDSSTIKQLRYGRFANLYEISDTTQPSVIDSLIVWEYTDVYTESYDNRGRLIELLFNQGDNPNRDALDYNISYQYNNNNQISRVIYDNYSYSEQAWLPILIEEYQYTDLGNPFYFEQRYYDNSTHAWEIQASKQFYYDQLTSINRTPFYTEKLKIVPNPANDVIYIKANSFVNKRYSIYDINGRLCASSYLQNMSINISNLDPGIYMLQISDNNTISTGKFVKH